MDRTIKLDIFLPYDRDLVWRALTDADLLGKWFMLNNIKAETGHYFTFRMKAQKGWDGITHCEIISAIPRQYLAYTYRGEATGEKALACAGIHSDKADKLTKGIFTKLDTVLSFSLEPTCDGTLLMVKQSGYKGIKLVLISFIMEMGWKKQLRKKLPNLLQKLNPDL
ncbi:hypothetical protein D3C87_250250 [compost metagenome]